VAVDEETLLHYSIDITKIKNAQHELARYSREVERANREVKDFAYIVSHDLKSPLINIRGFTRELKETLDELDSLTDQSRSRIAEKQHTRIREILEDDIPEIINYVDLSVKSIGRMIDSILKLSRLGRRDLDIQTVALSDIVESVLTDLEHRIRERDVKITVDPLPVVRADIADMEQVFLNLLDNALKYLDPTRPGRITIGAERQENRVTIYVSDNGVGIDLDDHDEMFRIFRRGVDDTIPGEGMGLAFVKTLAKRHNGDVQYESKPGVGSTFRFSFPQ